MDTKMKPSDLLFKLAILVMTALITVSCSKSDDNDEKGGGGVVPDPDIPTLSEITYDLNKNAVIIPEATTKQLSSVDTLGHKLTLPTSAGKPEVGQCLIFNTPTKQLPDGLLAKVKEVKESSKGYDIVYEDAQLKDAFKDIDIPEQYIPIGNYVEHVYGADGKELKYQTRAKTRASGVKSLELILPEVGLKIDKGVEFTPKMSIDLLLRYVFQFGDYELSYCGVKIDADVTVGADLTTELESSKLLEKKFHLLTLVCGAIPIGPVLLTPSIDMYFVVNLEGKIVLEASISYERTLHAGVIYQKGAGMKPTCELEPEAPDALKFTFGPKFEGGISWGLSMGGNIGVFGKTLAVRSRVNAVMKNTISGKLDMAAFSGTLKDWLTPYDLDASGTIPSAVENVKRLLSYANKWKFDKFEGFMLNQAIGIKVGWDLTTIGVDVASTSLPEMTVPISSIPICPQVKIDEKDFFAFDGDNVTLTLHHPQQSVLDDLTEYYAEFKPVDSKTNAKTLVKYFNFDDDVRNWLKAEVKGKDVTTTTKATLNGEDDYDITVFMKVLGMEIPIFEGYAKKDEFEPRTDLTSFSFYGVITTTYDTGRGTIKDKDYSISFGTDDPKTFSVTKTKDSYRVKGRASFGKLISSYFECEGEFDATFKLTKSGFAEVTDLKYHATGAGSEGKPMEQTLSVSHIALESDYTNGKLYKVFWRDTDENTLKITEFKGSHEIFWGGEYGYVTESYTYKENPKNHMGVTLEYGGN